MNLSITGILALDLLPLKAGGGLKDNRLAIFEEVLHVIEEESNSSANDMRVALKQ